MDVGELSCSELVELVTDYVEGVLPAEERMRFEQHVMICEGCTNYLEQMRETIRLTGMLREADLAPEARAELLMTFRDWKRP